MTFLIFWFYSYGIRSSKIKMIFQLLSILMPKIDMNKPKWAEWSMLDPILKGCTRPDGVNKDAVAINENYITEYLNN